MASSNTYNYRLEEDLLSQLIFDISKYDEISSILKDKDFYDIKNRKIYSLLSQMILETEVKDFNIELFNEYVIKRSGTSGVRISDINRIYENSITASSIFEVANQLKELSMLREIEEMSIETIKRVKQAELKSDEIIDKIEQNVNLLNMRNGISQIISISDLAQSYLEKKQDTDLEFLSTGYTQLDSILQGGFHKSDLIILAARPGMGKTSFALNLALNIASNNKNVLVFSLEMANDQLVDRLIAAEAQYSLTNIRESKFIYQENEKNRILNALKKIETLPIFVADMPSVSINDIKAMARKKARENQLDVIIIDYLQLIESTINRNAREQEVAQISRSLKILAKELNIPIISLAQLSRNVEHRSDQRPTLSDIRESGAIEQDADLVMFLYRKEYYNNLQSDAEITEVLIKKHRHGQQGTAYLKYNLKWQKFLNTTEAEEAQYKQSDNNTKNKKNGESY